MEIEGAADLVVECVSDSSERRDTERLKALYYEAGVREYWIVDARRDPTDYQAYRPGRRAYRAGSVDAHGFRRSGVLEVDVRFVRGPARDGLVYYRFDMYRLDVWLV